MAVGVTVLLLISTVMLNRSKSFLPLNNFGKVSLQNELVLSLETNTSEDIANHTVQVIHHVALTKPKKILARNHFESFSESPDPINTAFTKNSTSTRDISDNRFGNLTTLENSTSTKNCSSLTSGSNFPEDHLHSKKQPNISTDSMAHHVDNATYETQLIVNKNSTKTAVKPIFNFLPLTTNNTSLKTASNVNKRFFFPVSKYSHANLLLSGITDNSKLASKRTFNLTAVRNTIFTNKRTSTYITPGKKADKHLFREVLLPSISCANRTVDLVICVTGRRESFARRDVIRITWGGFGRQGGRLKKSKNSTDDQGDIILLFFLGSSPLLNASQKAEQNKIKREAKVYGDIYQVEFIDSYRNLTLKSLSILNFVSSRCSNARFVAKIDEDMYVNIPLLLSKLRAQKKMFISGISSIRESNVTIYNATIPPFVYGYLFSKASPHRSRDSKWYTSWTEFKYKFYPDYVSGTAYAMSGSAALRLFSFCFQIPLFWMEDIFVTGICRMAANISLIPDYSFAYNKLEPNGCSFINNVSGHGYTKDELITIHAQLNSPSLTCVTIQKRKKYQMIKKRKRLPNEKDRKRIEKLFKGRVSYFKGLGKRQSQKRFI